MFLLILGLLCAPPLGPLPAAAAALPTSCPAGLTLCDDWFIGPKCVNTLQDMWHCGACRNYCMGAACTAGVCTPCAPAEFLCARDDGPSWCTDLNNARDTAGPATTT